MSLNLSDVSAKESRGRVIEFVRTTDAGVYIDSGDNLKPNVRETPRQTSDATK
jgi:hypothetical protein